MLLNSAVAWNVIDKLPCSIRLLPVGRSEAAFHEFDSYDRLLDAAQRIDWRTCLIVLLGGEGGLHVAEIVALQPDVDHERGRIWVRHSDWRGSLTTPKNGGRANRGSHPASYVLLAPDDEGRATRGYSTTGGASGRDHDATRHAPESGRRGRDDSTAGARTTSDPGWRHCGDGTSVERKVRW